MEFSRVESSSVRPWRRPDLEERAWSGALEAFLEKPWKKRVLEIGCGVGLHPLRQAHQNPDDGWVAVERTSEKFDKFYRRFISHKSPGNLFPLHADAVEVLSQNHPWDEIWILYPNPEWKRPRRRWFFSSETELLLRQVRPQGKVVLATNIRDYAEGILRNAQEWGSLNIEYVTTEEKSWDPRSHFERKYMERGEICFDLTITVQSPLSTQRERISSSFSVI